ncbi:GAF domain-containing protein [Amycolatopsis thermophila]|uniref:Sugar diacid utilization regulator/GAF domain-containing protein n=1 Tax=Amycolatopsis thermophila TaxID=206084 RepID=A0ABU0F487_9PSEU|nr:GAF domain-containing protein [Amycolatopsis thermophila]MDQ0382303.1 sugar diacid utilization regulator/GAF domain-containing protein [Amycolatopsis thermophila]
MRESIVSALPPARPATGPAWSCDGANETGHRERDVIAAFSEVTTEAITATRLEGLLGLLGRKLCHLLGVMRCSVYLRCDDGRFRGAAGYCERDGDISAAVQTQEAGIPGDHFSREVIETAAPVLISDVTSDPRPHHRTMEHWRVRAMLGVPLVFDDEVIGLIFVDNVDQDHVYTGEDVALAELFARLGALFLRQAMLNAHLKRKAAEVVRQKNTLAYLADVHQKLTNAVLDGASIQAVVSLLSELSAKPVVLYNEDFNVLAWSAPPALKMTQPPVLPPRIREMPSVRQTLATLSASRPSAVVPQTLAVGLGRRHLMCRLIIEGQVSGYLGIVEVGRGLEHRDSKLAEHGATVLSLQILSERRQAEAEGQAREDYLSDLLHRTRDAEQLVRRGPQFGVDLSQPHVLVRFSLDSANQSVSVSVGRKLVVEQLARALDVPDPAAVSLPGAVIALVRLPDGAVPEDLRDAVGQVRAAVAPRLRVSTATISAVCRSAEDFPMAHRQLREIDELARSFGWPGGVLTADELGVFRVIAATGRVKEAVHFAHEFIRPLQDGDSDALLDTWRAFVAAQGRVQATAADLGVHENTIRYRLGKIRRLIQRDPSGLDCLLQARLAFQILDLAGW